MSEAFARDCQLNTIGDEIITYRFLGFWGIISVIITGNLQHDIPRGINECNVRIGAVQLQLFSWHWVGINYCNVTPFFTGFYLSEYNLRGDKRARFERALCSS